MLQLDEILNCLKEMLVLLCVLHLQYICYVAAGASNANSTVLHYAYDN